MKSLRNKLLFSSLRKKLIFSVIVCLLLPMIITVSISDLFVKKSIQDQIILNAEDSLAIVDSYISTTIERMVYISNYVILDGDFKRLITNNWKHLQINGDPTEKNYIINQIKINNKLIDLSLTIDEAYISVVFGDGAYYSNYSDTDYQADQLVREGWFDDASHIGLFATYWVGSHPSYIQTEKLNGQKLITIVRKIPNLPNGYIVVSIREQKLKQIFVNYASDLQILLLDQKGGMISGTEATLTGNPSYLEETLSGINDSGLVAIQGQMYLAVKRQLSYSNWSILSLIPYEEAVGKVSGIFRIITIVQIGFFSLFLFVLIYLIRQFTRPIIKLGEVVAKVESGDLQIRSSIRGRDEIGNLGKSFDRMLDRIDEMIQQIIAEQSEKRKAELDMLQAQINPHFLFNILNSIRMKIMIKGDEDSADLISSLSFLLRMTINRNNESIPLHEEIEMVKNYIKLMNIRQKDAIIFEADIASNCLLVEVPRFCIQPLIENAWIHGFQQKGGKITIKGWKNDRFLFLSIEDNGVGLDEKQLVGLQKSIFSESKIEQIRSTNGKVSGIGMRNVYERLKLIYGDEFNMSIHSLVGQGTKMMLSIPWSVDGHE